MNYKCHTLEISALLTRLVALLPWALTSICLSEHFLKLFVGVHIFAH